ncbi:MAG: phosphatase PAP2 family protein [Pseudobdellovibrionaceae bacterium]
MHSIDQAVFHLINIQMANPAFDIFFPAITDLHKTNIFRIVFIPFLLILWFYLYRLRGLAMAVLLAISLGLSDVFGAMAKRYWMRPRPFSTELDFIQRSGAGGFSFPSNHAANMFCAAFFLSAFFPRFRILFFTIAILVCISRIYNGVHYPSDIIAGAIIGTFFGVFGSKVAQQIVLWIKGGFQTNRRKRKHG